MLYLQKYLTNFQKPFFRRKKSKVAIGVVSFKAQTISFSNGNVTIFPTSRNCKNFNFPLYTFPAEMLYLRSIWRIFKNFFFAERRGGWLLSLTISSAQTCWFSYSNVTTFPTSSKCKNFNFRLFTVLQKCYISRSI